MTWHLKDREVEKALIKLCPYFVDRLNWGVSSKEMGEEYVYVSFDRTMNDWVLDDCELMFWMEELEDIPEYRTDKWNEYPKVTPPKNTPLRVECADKWGTKAFFDDCFRQYINAYKIENVVRFRPWED